MNKYIKLTYLFTLVAIVEAGYALLGLLTPPFCIQAVTGWVLTPDGQWLVKLLGAALGFQALVAWMFRKKPPIGLAKLLAGYQLLAATIDWVLWMWLADQGIFSSQLAKITVVFSIFLHYLIGILLLVAISKKSKSK